MTGNSVLVFQRIQEHLDVLNKMNEHSNCIEIIGQILKKTILDGHKILIIGNGGSAADAQHMASELTGRFVKNRKAIPALALTTDSSALTSVGNDFGFDQIFARQVEAFAQPGDVLMAISTSGKSPNIIEAIKRAKDKGCICVALSGKDGGLLHSICDEVLVVPSHDTQRIQEMHILVAHILCEMIENE
jgi:D-sedoheptulose 7-phosphate isomerase